MKTINKFQTGVKQLLSAVLFLCVGTSYGIAYGADQHAVALNHYQKGDYESAAGLLEQHLKHEPFDWNAHFYLGNCYNALGRRADAIMHYRLILTNQPGAEVAASSKAALARLEAQVHAEKSARQAAAPVQTPPPDPAKHEGPGHAQADADIERQSGERSAMLEQERQNHLNNIRRRFTTERERINSQLQSDISSVPRNWGGKRGRNWNYEATVSDLQQEASAKLERINEDEKRELDAAERTMNSRAGALTNSSSNVWNEIHNPGGSSVKINPKGTNLYIKNYEKDPPPPAVP